ncbi:MAG TPA: GNAT family N-acetyltransferase [Tepidisphaeraceae bacterium]|jgi:ribosomal protein S18 acetylase RimI-like enzyme|nr:GNAT family N-acetyltransferase [Tepidisphaeraceae bacterium]
MSDKTTLHIRSATRDDASTIADFNIRLAMETENLALDPSTIFPGVRAVLQDPSKGQYFVAEIGGSVVGCLMITHEWSDWRNGDIWWIQSVYVHPDFRRRGVFSHLYRHVEKVAAAAGAVGLRLYMEEENSAAQTTYERLGMHLTPYRVLEQMFKERRPTT